MIDYDEAYSIEQGLRKGSTRSATPYTTGTNPRTGEERMGRALQLWLEDRAEVTGSRKEDGAD